MTHSTSPVVRDEPQRRLSPLRVLVAAAITAVLIIAGVFGVQWWSAQSETTAKPWFASYVDVTATPTFDFAQLGATSASDAVLSFVVSAKTDACSPSWGSAYSMTQASDTLDLDRRIARLQQQGGSVAVSFGGQANSELAVGCTDPGKLLSAYQSVVDRYKISTIDLDLEGAALTDTDAGARRATAIAKLQSERRAAGKSLAVWVTLPVSPDGLSQDGTSAVSQLLAKGVDLAGVNAMTMDYGSSRGPGQSMLSASTSALTATQHQLGILYKRAGTQLSDATLWSKIGATPMIGQNDVKGEVFSVATAKAFNSFATSHGVGRMSMWSANRDIQCGSNYVDTTIVSDDCSGVKQGKVSFASVLSTKFDGHLSLGASAVTTSEPTSAASTKDNPATSPYAIWSPTSSYLKGTKIVWHHNVYVAKWWTKDDLPDDPVLNDWETPWQLIGPVLPGEKPIPVPTLAPNTFPSWQGTSAYDKGTRVLYNGVPYEAKWWTQGDSPEAAASDPDSSPWSPLTQAEIVSIDAAKAKPAS